MPRSQSAADRPIAFALHDTARNKPHEIFQMNIRPEDLTRNEPSRMSVNQTFGGAWVDSWGPGVPTVNLAGTTGWGAGGLPDGFEQFQKLHATVFQKWHALRAEVAAEGKDPNGIKLIFSDGLDDFVWDVAPMNFTLRRNKSRPLLSQYQIALTKLNDGVWEKPVKPIAAGAAALAGLSSIDGAIAKINDFAGKLKGTVAGVLGPIKAGVEGLVKLTTGALQDVRKLVAAGTNLVRSTLAPVLEIAQGLTKAASNVMKIVADIKSIPMQIKNEFMKVGSAFNNAYCLLRNAFKLQGYLPQYAGLYGSSNCASTVVGMVSPYVNQNVFPSLFPATSAPVSVSASAEKAIGAVANLDPLKPPPLAELGGQLNTINTGVTLTPGAADKAIASAKATLASNTGSSKGVSGYL